MNLKLSDFDYCLPKELIAQYPLEHRSSSRLLVLQKNKQKPLHRKFSNIIDYLSAGDCLVLNNTQVIAARMLGAREKLNDKMGGGKQEIFLLDKISKNIYRVLAKPAKKLTQGTKILFKKRVSAIVLKNEGRTKIVEFHGTSKSQDIWQEIGDTPLPPYIKRTPEKLDKTRYQTVYAKTPGATAAPTAGLHFTKELIEKIKKKGISIAYVTLHVNYGTFAPVECEDVTTHKMHKEYFILPKETASVINQTRKNKGRIFAVGTTAVRVLETCAAKLRTKEELKARQGWTDLFIYPPYKLKLVDALITNFHFPKSTLLMLVSAFIGKKRLFKVYEGAVKKKYRFFSYGDAMLIL